MLLQTARATLELAPHAGGAIASFVVDGVDILRRTGDEARARGDARGFACYPLVPYSNRIAHGRLRFGDETYALALNFGDHPHSIHGVGWQRPWQLESSTAERALLSLAHEPGGGEQRAWPFAFRATQGFELAEQGPLVALSLTIGIESRDHRPFPFGLGFHPFLPRAAGARLGFDATGVWRTDPTRLPVRLEPVPAEWRFDPLKDLDGLAIDNVFSGWSGTAIVDWPSERKRAVLQADRALGFVVVYVPEAHPYFAVEPVTHMTDAFNRAADGESDTGTRVLQPGESFSCTARITVQPLEASAR